MLFPLFDGINNRTSTIANTQMLITYFKSDCLNSILNNKYEDKKH